MAFALVAVVLLSTCIVALGSSLGVPVAESRISGGFNAEEGEYPYMAYIKIKNEDDKTFACSGAIITRKTILTAAHCFDVCKTCQVEVVVGTIHRDSGGTVYKSTTIKRPTSYNFSSIKPKPNDVALVIIDVPIVLSDKVKVVALNYGIVGGGIKSIVIGWGRTSCNGVGAKILQVLKVKTITNKQCISDAPRKTQIWDSHLCTYNKVGQRTCKGDSGGPLVSGGKVIGIVSGGVKCKVECKVGYPDYFTRVSSHAEWINQNKV